jgi:hypothetical protein
MTEPEDLVRSTTRAIAGTVRDVPPLRLSPAEGDLASFAPRARRPRRLRSWLAPATAAAVVLAVAVCLVIVRDIANGPVVPQASPAFSFPPGSAGPVPKYYVMLNPTAAGSSPNDLVIGETFTGKKLATIAPRKGTTFLVVSAAADDRTFIVDSTVFGPDGYRTSPVDPPATWYLLTISPGSKTVARLTRLSIPAMPSGQIGSAELSESGRELAVTLQLRPALQPNPGTIERPLEDTTTVLRIYSVATGKLLRSWSARDAAVDGGSAPSFTVNDALNWVDGDQAIAFDTGPGNAIAKRVLDVTAGGDDLIADSRVVWSQQWGVISAEDRPVCLGGSRPPLTPDGMTVVCAGNTTLTQLAGGGSRWAFVVAAYSTSAPTVGAAVGNTQYQASVDTTGPAGPPDAHVEWTDASGSEMIIVWGVAQGSPRAYLHFGVLNRGKFTPLPAPPGGNGMSALGFAW